MSVEAIVDEIVLVDTGSSDNTKDIANDFGAKIFDFEWTNNFSDARNFSLSKATGKWILILDADEVISPSDHGKFKELITPPHPTSGKEWQREVIAYNFVTRNYVMDPNRVGWTANDGRYSLEESGTGWIKSEKVRLFPNDSRIRFEYPVHERVEPSLSRYGIRIERCDIPVHHYGFLKEAEVVSKSERYYNSLKKDFFESAECNANCLYHLACEATQLEKYEEALEFWQKLKAMDPNFSKVLYYIGNVYFHLGRYENALTSLKKAMQLEPDSKDTIVMYAQAEICAGNVKLAIISLEGILNREPSYALAIFPLAIAYFCSGIKDKGMECVRKLRTMDFSCRYYFSEFAKFLIASGRIKYATLLLEVSIESDNIASGTFRLLQECYHKQDLSNIR